MTVLEAMNLLGLPQRPDDRAALKLAMLRAFEQTPRQHGHKVNLLMYIQRAISGKDAGSRATKTAALNAFVDEPRSAAGTSAQLR